MMPWQSVESVHAPYPRFVFVYLVNKVKEHVRKECERDELEYEAGEDDL